MDDIPILGCSYLAYLGLVRLVSAENVLKPIAILLSAGTITVFFLEFLGGVYYIGSFKIALLQSVLLVAALNAMIWVPAGIRLRSLAREPGDSEQSSKKNGQWTIWRGLYPKRYSVNTIIRKACGSGMKKQTRVLVMGVPLFLILFFPFKPDEIEYTSIDQIIHPADTRLSWYESKWFFKESAGYMTNTFGELSVEIGRKRFSLVNIVFNRSDHKQWNQEKQTEFRKKHPELEAYWIKAKKSSQQSNAAYPEPATRF